MHPTQRFSESSARAASSVVLAVMVGLFLWLGAERLWYDDDVFITLRYARHLAEGHGIVWNTVDGERIEGSTSLAWTVANALAIRCGLDPLRFSQTLGLAAGVVGLLLLYHVARCDLGLDRWCALVAPAVLVAHRQWVLWSASSHEIRLATVGLFAATVAMVRAPGSSRNSWVGGITSGLLFLLATTVRPESPLIHLAVGIGLLLVVRQPNAARTVLSSGGTHALGLILLVAWRLSYFGQPLPNTFYAKVGGIQLSRGLRYLYEFVAQTHGLLWVPIVLLGLWLGRRRQAPLVATLVATAAAWCSWIAIEGGAFTEFRFLDPLLPGLAVLLAFAVQQVQRRSTPVAVFVAVALVASQAMTLFRPFKRFFAVSAEHLHSNAEFMLLQGRTLAPYLTPSDRIATGWAGALPYVTDAWHLDTWGLNHREIARRPFDPNGPLHHQRHATWDDVVGNRVMFCDVYNRFLFEELPDLNLLHPRIKPWIRPGVPLYGVMLPQGRLRYWLFASPLPPSDVSDWVTRNGLVLVLQTTVQ